MNKEELHKLITFSECASLNTSLYWTWSDIITANIIVENETKYTKTIKGINDKLYGSFSKINLSSLNEIDSFHDEPDRTSLDNKYFSEVISLLGPSLKGKSSKFIDAVEEMINKRPNQKCHISSQQLGGNTLEIEENTSSFIHRESIWKPWITASWQNNDHNEKRKSLEWIEETWDILKFYFPWIHLAQMHPHLKFHKKEIKAAFGNWLPELQQLKSKYDPEGILPLL